MVRSIYAAPDLSSVTAYMVTDDDASFTLPIDVSAFSAAQQTALAGVLAGLAEQIPPGETIIGPMIVEPVKNGKVTESEEQELDGETVEVPTAWEDDYRARVSTVDDSPRRAHRTREVMVSEPSRQFLRAVIEGLEAEAAKL